MKPSETRSSTTRSLQFKNFMTYLCNLMLFEINEFVTLYQIFVSQNYSFCSIFVIHTSSNTKSTTCSGSVFSVLLSFGFQCYLCSQFLKFFNQRYFSWKNPTQLEHNILERAITERSKSLDFTKIIFIFSMNISLFHRTYSWLLIMFLIVLLLRPNLMMDLVYFV